MAIRLRRWFGILGGILAVILLGVPVYVAMTWDRVYDAPLQEVQVSTDPAVLARGEYLVYGPAHCVQCHAGSLEGMQKLAEGERVPLSGGIEFALGPLGTVYTANLTPDPETGIGRHSDAQIARMMRWSVRPNGRATLEPLMPFGDMATWFVTPNITPMKGSGLMKFPDRETFVARFQRGGRQHAGSLMPWEAFALMSTEDLGALYEYLHSLQPEEGPTGDPAFRRTD